MENIFVNYVLPEQIISVAPRAVSLPGMIQDAEKA
jgi:hypothetical protein